MRIANIVGARPNFMKIAPIMDEMRNYPELDPLLVHTGQHYDDKMSKLFFDDLGIPRPDINLCVGSGSHATQTARIMSAFEEVLFKEHPDMVLVVGDTNSTMACALTAAKLNVPVAHVEAGLRSFDRTMPEEINRIVTDAISDILFTTEQSANENLRREGIPEDKIHFVGNVMIDTLLKNKQKAQSSTILHRLGLLEEQTRGGSDNRHSSGGAGELGSRGEELPSAPLPPCSPAPPPPCDSSHQIRNPKSEIRDTALVPNPKSQVPNLKSEIRNPKFEIRVPVSKSEIRNPKSEIEYAVLTLHRPSNVDDRAALTRICEALAEISKRIPIIFPAHPRTRNRIADFGLDKYFHFLLLNNNHCAATSSASAAGEEAEQQDFQASDQKSERTDAKNSPLPPCSPAPLLLRSPAPLPPCPSAPLLPCKITCVEPLGYLDFLCLTSHAKLLITDSGGLQDEAPILGVPCITLRDNTERPATLGGDMSVLVGNDTEKIIAASVNALDGRAINWQTPQFWDGKAAQRIVEILATPTCRRQGSAQTCTERSRT